MRCRVRVEVEWFIALSDAGFAELPPLGPSGARASCAAWSRDFSRRRRRGDQGDRAHAPTTTSRRSSTGSASASPASRRWRGAAGFIHFACTSEDINNTSHALMLEGGAARGAAAGARRASIATLRRDGAASTPRSRCWRARTARRRRRRRSARRSPTSSARLARARDAHRRGDAARQDERRGRQLQRPPRRLSRVRLGGVRAPRRRGAARPRLQPAHDPDRAARPHGRAVRRDQALPTRS